MKLLDRYVVSELAGPFGFGVGAFTAILAATTVLFHLVTLMVQHGLSASLVGQVFALRLPEMAFYTFPMSMLLACLLGFGRLSGDGEITAFKAAGVGLLRLAAPALALALAVGVGTVALNETLVPWASFRAKQLLYEATHQSQPLPVARDHLFYHERSGGELKRLFYARRFDGAAMHDVVVQEFEHNRLVRIVQASEAAPTESGWRFLSGVIYQIDDRGEYRYTVRFNEQRIALDPALLALSLETRSPLEQSGVELAAHVARLEAAGQTGREVNELRVHLHQKLAVPFASVVFALVGLPLGLRPQRASAGIGLGVSILVIFGYYVLMFFGLALGQTGALPPAVGAWLPNVVAGGIGAALLVRAARR